MAKMVGVGAPAVEARERLVGFVAEIVAGLPRVRRRENAGLYVRGLIEEGGRKSLQPTLFRIEESSARYESVQSSWPIRHGIRVCWCGRVPSG